MLCRPVRGEALSGEKIMMKKIGIGVVVLIALVCFWIMLRAQFAQSALVVRAAGVEPAQRLRTEGF